MEVHIGKLTFRLVDFNQLKHQHQYVIMIEIIHRCYLAGRFLEKVCQKPLQNDYYGARFFIRDIDGSKRGLRTFTENESYYELIPKKHIIQQRMEQRATNLIIRKLIGDDHFEW